MPRKPKTRAPYLMVSDPTWALARADYLIRGMTAQAVADKHGIGLHNLRSTMSLKGWTKRDLADARAAVQPDAAAGVPPPPDPVAEARAAATGRTKAADPAGGDLLEAVLTRVRTALTSGRGAEASALLKAAREFVIVQQDVADARAAVAPGVELWDTAQPARAGAATETLMIQTLHGRWSKLTLEEQIERVDPDGSTGLRAWAEAQAAAGARKAGR